MKKVTFIAFISDFIRSETTRSDKTTGYYDPGLQVFAERFLSMPDFDLLRNFWLVVHERISLLNNLLLELSGSNWGHQTIDLLVICRIWFFCFWNEYDVSGLLSKHCQIHVIRTQCYLNVIIIVKHCSFNNHELESTSFEFIIKLHALTPMSRSPQ